MDILELLVARMNAANGRMMSVHIEYDMWPSDTRATVYNQAHGSSLAYEIAISDLGAEEYDAIEYYRFGIPVHDRSRNYSSDGCQHYDESIGLLMQCLTCGQPTNGPDHCENHCNLD